MRILILLILFFSASTFAQKDSLVIMGKIANAGNHTSITLLISHGNILQKKETFKIKNDSFKITYHLKETPNRIKLIESDQNQKITVWVENDTIEIIGHLEDFSNAQLNGAKYTASEKQFKSHFHKDSSTQYQLKVLEKNLNTPSAVYRLSRNYRNYPSEEVEKLYNKLSDKWKIHDFGISIKNYLHVFQTKPPKINDYFPKLEGIDQNENSFALSQLKNDKFILLEFSSYACPWSRKSIPILKDFHKNYEDKIEIITFVQDTREAFWKKFFERWNIRWKVIWDGFGEIGTQYIALGIKGTPKYYLLNKHKKIVDKWDGVISLEQLENRVDKALRNSKK